MNTCLQTKQAKNNLRYTISYVMTRVGQNRICTPYMIVCMMISLPKIPYLHLIYPYMFGSGQP